MEEFFSAKRKFMCMYPSICVSIRRHRGRCQVSKVASKKMMPWGMSNFQGGLDDFDVVAESKLCMVHSSSPQRRAETLKGHIWSLIALLELGLHPRCEGDVPIHVEPQVAGE